jgi:hypothetical protein
MKRKVSSPERAVTYPAFDAWKTVDVLQLGDEVRLADENLLTWIELDACAQNFPRGIIDPIISSF